MVHHGPIVTGFPLTCKLCPNNLLPDKGHEFCPSCLGIQHLKDALTDPCVHYSLLPLWERRLRLAELDPNSTVHIRQADPAAQRIKKCCASTTTRAPPSKKKETALSKTVAVLSSEMAKLKRLLHSLQQPIAPVDPMQDDGAGIDPVARLGLDTSVQATQPNVFFRQPSAENSFSMPPCNDFVAEFSNALTASAANRRCPITARILPSMAEADSIGVGRTPEVEQPVAALVVSTDEALRGNV
ncbi:putative disrupted in schizophrenia 1 protein-like [Triplophysa rosa]|uniref:Disrupted in schizophrenia 1 protein-like n=1 Tax=Triplophysa rosa TaxID=992332 RepID=A0A9W7WNS0_TRIRA|nr:putative disrupted in schizophrenia 1 protein-like [Triplophysa rosa]